ncbi:hypothetical protein [Glycomyces tenuis]|uniref:hypothetical protein n=1 Tax=Glycomyces tenuis TaxID=58116 RepID=UPI0004041DD6|nr:hypothetical protein [Glycomyces tenuis]
MQRSMKRISRAGLAIASLALAAGLALFPSSAAVAQGDAGARPPDSQAPAPAAEPAVANPPCQQSGNAAVEADVDLNFRRAPNLDATVDGIIPQGEVVPWCGFTTEGGSYSDCGAENWTMWDWVNWNNQSGWVASACVTFIPG